MRASSTALIAFAALLAAVTCPAIEIDGQFNDWTNAVTYDIPQELRDGAGSSYGRVERLQVSQDGAFLYFRIEFTEARPFDPATESGWRDQYWANTRYIVLDVDGDSKADYYTNQINLKGKGGFNNTYVVKLGGEKPTTYLWHYGHSAWDAATGTMGHYSEDGRQIEMRVPIEPLGISTKVIGVQVQMSLRDGIGGENKWTNDRYPSAESFYLYDLAAGAKIAATAATARPTVEMLPTAAAPAIDGQLDEPVWRNAPVLSDFRLNRGSMTPQAATHARVTYDADTLYLAVEADEPDMGSLRTDAVEAESKRVWNDDCIEVFVDFHNDDTTYFHIGITAIGMLAGEIGIASGASDTSISIEPSVDVAYAHEAGGWRIEAAVPFSNMGVKPQPGEVWGFNICRSRPGGREYSSWAGVQGRFAQPKEFGDMMFASDAGLVVASRGIVARKGNAADLNVLRGSYSPAADAPLTLKVTATAGQTETFSDTATVAATGGAETEFALPYVVKGLEGEVVSFEISTGDGVLYAATVPVMKTEYPRAWQTPDPLYAELMGDGGPGMGAEGVLYWSHEIVTYEMAPFCLKHAQPFVLEDMYRNAAERKMWYFDGGTMIGGDNFKAREYCRKHGAKTIYMGSHRAHAEGKPVDGSGTAYLADPENQAVYLQRIREYLPQWREYIWGFSTGDEVQDHEITLGLEFHYGEGGPYPFMEQVDAEVREKYGYGKWGIPESLTDKNPFRWIAYRRWYNDQFARFQKAIFDTVREIDPAIRVIGPDPIAQIQPFDYSAYGRHCDIVTHQIYPRGPYEQDAAWITKTLRDLAGVPTMPCVHVENYANSFRPDEAREIMSQVYRAGGEGFHLYMPDTAGSQGGTHCMVLDRWGSWPRWQTVMGTLDNSRTLSLPKLPQTRVGVLLSEDAYMAEFLGGRQGEDQYRWMFSMLGPAIRGWFTVISDSQIARGEVGLDSFDTIYVPKAEYERREVVEKLVGFVRAGGRLVVTDPDAFTWHLDGSRMDDLRAQLFPAASEPVDYEFARATPDAPNPGFADSLPSLAKGAELELGANDRAVLAYDTGKPAAVARRLGEGVVYHFGFETMLQKNLESPAWRSYWKQFHAGLGEQTDLDIWRFTFPHVAASDIAPPAGKCLTNNYIVWDTNEAVPVNNLEIAGTYSYSLKPDYAADQGGVTDIPFSKGDLMDRRSAVAIKDPADRKKAYRENLDQFAVGWATTEPLQIEFTFDKPYALDRIWLMYTRQLPGITVEGLAGGEWVRLGELAAQRANDQSDYPAVTIGLDAGAPAVERMRMSFAARGEKEVLLLPELEVWARQ